MASALAYISEGHCELISAEGIPIRVSVNCALISPIEGEERVIDGELVCLDSEGRSIFNELLLRKAARFSTH